VSRHRQYCSSSNFAALLQEFFIERLMQQRAASPQTIASYRDTFRLFLQFAQARLRKSPVGLALADIDVDLVLAFLRHLQDDRHNCAHPECAACCHSFISEVRGTQGYFCAGCYPKHSSHPDETLRQTAHRSPVA
jgi:hypothetical protein